MYTHRYYTAVTVAKELVGKYIEENDDLLNIIRNGDVSRILRSNKYSRSITAKAAIATVLTSGTFLETGQFMMPSTLTCLSDFRYVRRQLSDRRPLVVSVADSNHNIYPIRI